MSVKRIQILSQTEVDKIYDYPLFSPEEQCCFFSVEASELAMLEKFKTTETKICFLLMLGYFKAKNLFYTIDYTKSVQDIHYLLNNFFPAENFPEKYPGKSSLTKIKALIRLYFHTGDVDQQRRKIIKKIQFLVKLNTIPIICYIKY